MGVFSNRTILHAHNSFVNLGFYEPEQRLRLYISMERARLFLIRTGRKTKKKCSRYSMDTFCLMSLHYMVRNHTNLLS